jgi:hypothetical protein
MRSNRTIAKSNLSKRSPNYARQFTFGSPSRCAIHAQVQNRLRPNAVEVTFASSGERCHHLQDLASVSASFVGAAAETAGVKAGSALPARVVRCRRTCADTPKRAVLFHLEAEKDGLPPLGEGISCTQDSSISVRRGVPRRKLPPMQTKFAFEVLAHVGVFGSIRSHRQSANSTKVDFAQCPS